MTLIIGTPATGASAATLASLRDRIEVILSDTSNTNWPMAELDEAIRHTLDEYTQVSPHHAITTLTLAADGREIDVSGIAGLIEVRRVWWEYTAADPEYPPNWRVFEQWPGNILWINTGREPATGDVVRIWYTARHTLNGLDNATATTLPDEHVSLIVTGAAAQAAQNHAQSIADQVNVDGWTPKRYSDWAAEKNQQFHNGLARIARQRAAQISGIAAAAPLDRQDE